MYRFLYRLRIHNGIVLYRQWYDIYVWGFVFIEPCSCAPAWKYIYGAERHIIYRPYSGADEYWFGRVGLLCKQKRHGIYKCWKCFIWFILAKRCCYGAKVRRQKLRRFFKFRRSFGELSLLTVYQFIWQRWHFRKRSKCTAVWDMRKNELRRTGEAYLRMERA